MLVPLLLFLATGVRWSFSANQATPSGGLPFESARSIGKDLMIPLCQAHFCNGSKTETKGRICGCADDCLRRRDCCLDALTQDHVHKHMDDDLLACVPTLRGHGPFLLVGRCPANWTNEVVRVACEGQVNMTADPNRALPVVSTRTNNTYKNIYCGQCNEGDIKPGQFHLKFKCEEGNVSSVQEALKDNTCDAFVDAASVGYCETMDKTVTSCPDTWGHENKVYTKEVRWRCDVHFGPLTVQDQRYKNVFCAICNGATIDVANITCRNSYYPIEKEFVLTLDGEFATGSLIPSSGGKVCNPGEVYDPFRKQCRTVICKNAADCNETSSAEWNDIALMHSASPCNMMLIRSDDYDMINETVTLKNTSVSYRRGEYEIVSVNDSDSVLVCRKTTEKSISLFPQHFCERRNLLGYGSCGCQSNCVQSRSCCLDAFDDSTVDAFRKHEPWTCLNDSTRSSAIAKCPAAFKDSAISSHCVNPPPISQDAFANIPVFAWEHSALYRNVFCAVCNGATNVTFHKLHFLCAEHASMRNGWEAAEQFAAKPGLCELQVELPDQDLPVKPCVMDPHCRQCPETWGENGDPFQVGVLWRCEHYYAPVAIDGVCYRNDFCAVCNGVEPTDNKRQRFFSDHLLKPVRYSGLLEKGIFTTFTVG